MAWHNTYGKLGEEKVSSYLLANGYVILERNWRIGRYELDFILLDEDCVVVVEVKTRSHREEYPEELLSYKKRKNLIAAGSAYLTSRNIKKEIRFDLIVVIGKGMEIEHIKEAIDLF